MENNKGYGECGETGTFNHCQWECKMIQWKLPFVENGLAVPQ
jgi:hypothetical protein